MPSDCRIHECYYCDRIMLVCSTSERRHGVTAILHIGSRTRRTELVRLTLVLMQTL